MKKESARAEAKTQQSEDGSAHSPVLIFLILVSVNLMLIFDRLILRMHRKQMKTQKCIQDPKQRKESRDTKHSRRRRWKSP